MRVHTGEYIVTVEGNSIAKSQIVTVKAHQTQSYTIKPTPASSVEPVSDTAAQNIIAGSSRAFYLDSGTGHLTRITSANDIQVMNSTIKFQGIRWADSSFGLGQDTAGKFYTITNGIVAPLNTSGITSKDDSTNYAVAPNKTIYISMGSVLYQGSSSGGNFKKIYTSKGDPSSILATNTTVAVIVSPDSDGKKTDVGEKPSIILIDNTGKKLAEDQVGTFVAALAPDGNHVAVADEHGGELLDNKLKKVGTIPKPNFSNPLWLDNSTLFYSFNDQLWTYNITTQAGSLVANAPLGNTIQELSLSDDKAYIYMGVNHINNSSNIKRVGLHNQPVASVLSQLQSIMPFTGDGYFMSLVNFTSPVVLITPLPPLTGSTSSYLQTGIGQLQQQGIDTSNIQVTLANP